MTDNTQQIQGDPPEYLVKGCESFPLVRQTFEPRDFTEEDKAKYRTMQLTDAEFTELRMTPAAE